MAGKIAPTQELDGGGVGEGLREDNLIFGYGFKYPPRTNLGWRI